MAVSLCRPPGTNPDHAHSMPERVPVGTGARFMLPLVEAFGTRPLVVRFTLPSTVDIQFVKRARPTGKSIVNTHRITMSCAFFDTPYLLSGTFRGPVLVTVEFLIGTTVIQRFPDLIRVDVV